MPRCLCFTAPRVGAVRRLLPLLALSAASALGLLAAAASLPSPAQAQMLPTTGAGRNFPEAALRGTLRITGQNQAEINGKAIRTAPGMRLFNPENALVMMHTVIGQKFTVNYVIEPSTGLLIAAWVLSTAEAAQPRQGSGVSRSFFFGSD